MSIGSDLRQAREQRGLTLRDISERTKIRGPLLKAIEQDQFDPAVGAVLMRGFVKLYAREVGLDPAEIAARLPDLTSTAAGPAAAVGPGGEGRTPGTSTASRAGLAVAAAVILVVGTAAFAAWRWTSSPAAGAGTPAPQATPASDPVPPATAAAPKTEIAPAPAAPAVPPAPDPGVLRVELAATDASWLAATADGQRVAYRTLNAGDTLMMDVRNEAVLRIGVPGNVTVRINGRPVRPRPSPAVPATLRITPDTYRELLVP